MAFFSFLAKLLALNLPARLARKMVNRAAVTALRNRFRGVDIAELLPMRESFFLVNVNGVIYKNVQWRHCYRQFPADVVNSDKALCLLQTYVHQVQVKRGKYCFHVLHKYLKIEILPQPTNI